MEQDPDLEAAYFQCKQVLDISGTEKSTTSFQLPNDEEARPNEHEVSRKKRIIAVLV